MGYIQNFLDVVGSQVNCDFEVLIADGYRRARIPMYWICLQMTGNPNAILYLNVYHAREEADRAAATYTSMVPKHADLLRLQQRLTKQTASPPISMLATRRDEFVLGRRDVDFATNKFIGTGGNARLFLQAMDWATTREDLVPLNANIPAYRPLDLTAARTRYARVLSMGVVPGLFLLAGAWVWAIRRRR